MKKHHSIIIFFSVLLGISLLSAPSHSKEEYAQKSGQECQTCHVEEGGALTETGRAFQASGYRWPPETNSKPLLALSKTSRLIIGFIHFLTAFLWFGTILYVHIILRPAYAAKGLPRGEALLGLASMVIIFITGALLTFAKINDLSILTATAWGNVLLVKISLFGVMVATGLGAVFIIGPKLKKGAGAKATIPSGGVFDTKTLSKFCGECGNPAFVAFDGKVYDVSGSKRWSGGVHFKRHSAGKDLTADMKSAPHGAEKFAGFREVGTYDSSSAAQVSVYERAFYAVAYLNLFIVFAIIFIMSYWKWGI